MALVEALTANGARQLPAITLRRFVSKFHSQFVARS
jgi:hypothetical protein